MRVTADHFTFEPITVDEIPLLLEWRGRPHVAEWWGEAPSLEELRSQYASRLLHTSPVRPYFACIDRTPVGFIQSYVAAGSGDGWWTNVHDPGVLGIDQFLADASLLGRGLGTSMVRQFVEILFTSPSTTMVQADPHPSNARAIRCYEKAGFRTIGPIITPDGDALLMTRNR